MPSQKLTCTITPSSTLSAAAAAGGDVAVLFFFYNSHKKDSERRRRQKQYEERIAKLEETRQAERTGRIRAEMKLRTCLKNQQISCDEGDTTENGVQQDDDVNDVRQQHKQQNNQQLQLQCIGTRVHSPWYGRGYIQLNIPVECVEG